MVTQPYISPLLTSVVAWRERRPWWPASWQGQQFRAWNNGPALSDHWPTGRHYGGTRAATKKKLNNPTCLGPCHTHRQKTISLLLVQRRIFLFVISCSSFFFFLLCNSECVVGFFVWPCIQINCGVNFLDCELVLWLACGWVGNLEDQTSILGLRTSPTDVISEIGWPQSVLEKPKIKRVVKDSLS